MSKETVINLHSILYKWLLCISRGLHAAGYSDRRGHARQRRRHSTHDCSHAAAYRCSSSATLPQVGHACPSSTLQAERGDCMPSMDSAVQRRTGHDYKDDLGFFARRGIPNKRHPCFHLCL